MTAASEVEIIDVHRSVAVTEQPQSRRNENQWSAIYLETPRVDYFGQPNSLETCIVWAGKSVRSQLYIEI